MHPFHRPLSGRSRSAPGGIARGVAAFIVVLVSMAILFAMTATTSGAVPPPVEREPIDPPPSRRTGLPRTANGFTCASPAAPAARSSTRTSRRAPAHQLPLLRTGAGRT
jgi:hypothetical protein